MHLLPLQMNLVIFPSKRDFGEISIYKVLKSFHNIHIHQPQETFRYRVATSVGSFGHLILHPSWTLYQNFMTLGCIESELLRLM